MAEKKVYLLLGGNLGDRQQNLEIAKMNIVDSIGEIKNTSSIYQTEAWGLENQPDFLNQVVEVSSVLEPSLLIEECLSIETRMGRIRKVHWGERLIDIDVLFIDNEVINTQRLTVPHPEIKNRRFTLQPLVELIPTYKHPVLDKTIEQLLYDCSDELQARIFK